MIGVNHDHILGMTRQLLDAGGELVAFFADDTDLALKFADAFPQASRARTEAEVLEDASIRLVASAAIPDQRGALGIAAMRHGKDYLSDKPAFTTLDQLEEARRVQRRDTADLLDLLQRTTAEPRHRARRRARQRPARSAARCRRSASGPTASTRRPPAWFFEHARYGGILTDIGSHQADQFLFFTGSTTAEVVAAQVGNLAHPEYPELDDFGDMLLRGDGGSGYVRVDWFTPDGLSTWGDGRLTILGTDGYIELRKYVDIGGGPGGDHLFLVDQQQTRYIDCRDVALPFGPQLLDDVRHRTDTAMPQAHAFLASELALRAQLQAQRVGRELVAA